MKKKKAATVSAHTRAVAYLRVSTDKQADEGISLDQQRTKVKGYAALEDDFEVIEIIVDAGESAGSLDRPGLQKALAMLREGTANALLVVKLDRLTRSVRDLCELVDDYFRDGHYRLMSVSEKIDTSSAAGRMMLNLLTVIGQWEREVIAERTTAAMAHLKSQNKKTGGYVPYGYQLAPDGKTLRALKREQLVIEQIRNLKASGLGLRAIARSLDDRGIHARSGERFHHTQIARILE
jgi:DNA invertase Pin-like site-specific DNA recombinase